MIVLAALIGLSCPAVNAYTQDVQIMNSPLAQPEVSKSGYTYKFYSVGTNTVQDITYLSAVTLVGSSDIVFFEKGVWAKSSNSFSVEYNVFNAETGVLLSSFGPSNATYNSYQGYYQSRFSTFAPNNSNPYYIVIPDGMIDSSSNPNYSNQYVVFKPQAPDVELYKSVLSEPVADEFNSYFIANNGLYWLSYRFNGLYRISNSIENESYTESSSGTYSGSGSGSYAGQSNGYTEEFSMLGDFVGTTAMDPFLGQWQSDPQQIDFVGVSQGTIHESSSGTLTFNNTVIYPVSFDQSLIHRLFDVVVYLQNDKSFSFRIYPNESDLSGYVVDVDIYISSFYLSSGKYVGSTYHNYTGALEYCGSNFQLNEDNDPISAVKCYGCHFANINEVPVNLSSVLWQYDTDFEEWRIRMEDYLSGIYNLLNGSEGETAPAAPTYPAYGQEIKSDEPNFSDVDPDNVKEELSAAAHGIESYQSYAGTVRTWIDNFLPGKLKLLIIFVLGFGVVLLILGKNKDD